MADLSGFDASTVDPKADFEPLPAGNYVAVAIGSGFEKTKNGNGEFLKFEFEVIEGPHRGSRLFDRLNLKNPNDQAVKIAQATLSSICRAVGVLRPKDSAELHNRPVILKVELEPRADKPGSFSNKVKNYESVGNAAMAGAPSTTSQPANADTSVPPWKRKSA